MTWGLRGGLVGKEKEICKGGRKVREGTGIGYDRMFCTCMYLSKVKDVGDKLS